MFDRLRGWLRRSSPSALDDFWYSPIVPSTASGAKVNEWSALNNSTVWACVRLLSEDIAGLPLRLYKKRATQGRDRATGHPLYDLVGRSPAPWLSSFTWREVKQAHVCTWGNCFSQLLRDGRGRVTQILPLRPDRMKVARGDDGGPEYLYQKEGQFIPVPRDRILQVHGLGFDGLVGYSPIQKAREAIGLGQSAEKFGAKLFGSGLHPGFIFKHPNKLDEGTYDRLKKSLQAKAGADNAYDGLIIEDNMEAVRVGIPPEDAQFLGTRQHQVTDIATRWYRVPAHMAGDLEHATFSNIEHQAIQYVTYTLRSWLVRWEQQLNMTLLTRAERDAGYYFEHNVDALLRGDFQSRNEGYSIGRQNGWYSANDVLDMENRNPIGPEGDVYLVPLNMVPAGDLINPVQRSTERRAAADLSRRQRIRKSHRRVLGAASQKIVNRETLAVKRAAKKDGFGLWLDDFYNDTMPEVIRRELGPGFASLAETMADVVATEIDFDTVDREALGRFVEDYLTAYSARHIGSSRGQIKALLRDADLDAVVKRVDAWSENRADQIAANETVRLSSASARWVYLAGGVTVLRWQIQGAKTCPYCTGMDGRTVGYEGNFVDRGQSWEPEGADGSMLITGPISHPPLHKGCDCEIVAG